MHSRSAKALQVLLVAACHFVVQLGALAIDFELGMNRFDSGEPATVLELAAHAVSTVLCTPLLQLLRFIPAFPGSDGYVLFVLNSLLWATAIVWLYKVWQSRQSRRARSVA